MTGSSSGTAGAALLVEHGSNRGSLAAARDLAKAGWAVHVLATGESATAWSRSVRSRTVVDFPRCGPESFVEATCDAVARTGADVLLPVDETQLLLLSAAREHLGALLPYPAHEVVVRGLDRGEQVRAASAAGLTPPEVVDLDEDTDDGEVVVKARQPTLHEDGDGSWRRIETWIGPANEARAAVAAVRAQGAEAIVQRAVVGALASTTVLTDASGRVLARAQQRAERIWPADAGTSTRARTVPVDWDLARRVERFLTDLGWHGLVQLQFLVTPAGAQHFIDFNPRFYGSLALAVGAGARVPSMFMAAVTGAAIAPAEARPGVRYHWLGGDVRRALRQRHGGLARDVVGTLAWNLGAVRPLWSWGDPGPAVRTALMFARRRI